MDQDGDVIDILVQPRRNQRGAERFFRRLLRGQGKEPFRIVSDKLRSYSAALRTIPGGLTHSTERYANNRAEVSHRLRAKENGRCGDLNLLIKLNVSSPSTASSRISSDQDGTC